MESDPDAHQKLSSVLDSLPANLAAANTFQLLQASEAIEEILETQDIAKAWLEKFKIQAVQGEKRSYEGLAGDRMSIAFYEYFCKQCGYSLAEEDVDVDLLGQQLTCPHDREKLILRQQDQP
ncbi:MAG: hypothetical protein BJG00_006015 [Limnothrix sp. CACIAM 69d]|nr:MAG: hypothetical protein BJG00_006015 [Limnothrix sp. CACIAM 69d]